MQLILKQISSALFYALTSITIIGTNKLVLTSYKFNSYQTLALGQLLATVCLIRLAHFFKIIHLTNLNVTLAKKLTPLALLALGNLYFGLSGTKSLSLPMFVVMRRFVMLMLLYGEIYVLNVKKTRRLKLSVYVMVCGACIAAFDDLTFDLYGYWCVMLNNIFTSLNGIYTKAYLSQTNLNEFDILYYNAFFAMMPMFVLVSVTGGVDDLNDVDHLNNIGFWLCFMGSCCMGVLLNYSSMLCTKHNSPLTTGVVGTLKNVLITYGGVFVGGDYLYPHLNFLGLTMSTAGSLMYTFATFTTNNKYNVEVKVKST